MMLGILFENRKRLPVPVAVAMARREFSVASHTQGLTPTQIRFHPTETPPESTLDGLAVFSDPTVPQNHIRVCVPVQDEFCQDMQEFAHQVDLALDH